MAEFENQDFLAEINLAAVGTGTLEGRITGLVVQEDDGTGTFLDSTVIRRDRKWNITLQWELAGTALEPDILNLNGDWVVKAFLEGWGASATDHDFDGSAPIPLNHPGPHEQSKIDPTLAVWLYSVTIDVDNANHVDKNNNPDPIVDGTYRLAVAVTYNKKGGTPGPMAGFVEFVDMIQIYTPA